jgi:hypothetical protein
MNNCLKIVSSTSDDHIDVIAKCVYIMFTETAGKAGVALAGVGCLRQTFPHGGGRHFQHDSRQVQGLSARKMRLPLSHGQ